MKVFTSFWLRWLLKVVVGEALLLVVAWILHESLGPFQRISFSDELFIIGALAGAIGSTGMFRNPYGWNTSPIGVQAYPVQTSEEEKRVQLLVDFMRQRSIGLLLLAIGLLTILASAGILLL